MTNSTGPKGQDAHAAGQQADEDHLSSGQARVGWGQRLDVLNKEKFEADRARRAEELKRQQEQGEADLRGQLWALKGAQEPIENLPQEGQTQIQGQASTRMQAAMTQAGMTLNQEFNRLREQPGNSTTRSVDPARVAAAQRKVTERRAAHRQAQSQERDGQGNDR